MFIQYGHIQRARTLHSLPPLRTKSAKSTNEEEKQESDQSLGRAHMLQPEIQ